jgi:hypothetical protein
MIDERRMQSGDNRRTPYLLWMWRMLLSPIGANGDRPGSPDSSTHVLIGVGNAHGTGRFVLDMVQCIS